MSRRLSLLQSKRIHDIENLTWSKLTGILYRIRFWRTQNYTFRVFFFPCSLWHCLNPFSVSKKLEIWIIGSSISTSFSALCIHAGNRIPFAVSKRGVNRRLLFRMIPTQRGFRSHLLSEHRRRPHLRFRFPFIPHLAKRRLPCPSHSPSDPRAPSGRGYCKLKQSGEAKPRKSWGYTGNGYGQFEFGCLL